MYSITLLPESNSYCTYQVEQRFETDKSFFKALYMIAQVNNYVGNDLASTIKFLNKCGYVITLPNH